MASEKKRLIIDLSQPVARDIPVRPVMPKTFIGLYHRHEDKPPPHFPEGVSFATSLIVMSDHAGTHLDSTYHFNPHGHTAEQIPLEFLYGEGVVVDFSSKKPGDSITAEDFEAVSKRVGVRVKARDVVLLRTGASEKWNSPDYNSHIVQIKAGLLEWLTERGVVVVGVDMSSLDIPPNFEAHLFMRRKPYYHIENLANLDKIPQPRFKFIGLPLRLVGATASPIRAVAIIE